MKRCAIGSRPKQGKKRYALRKQTPEPARCGDGCKPEARLSDQVVAPIQAMLGKPVNDRLTGSVGRFFLLLRLFVAVIGTTLA